MGCTVLLWGALIFECAAFFVITFHVEGHMHVVVLVLIHVVRLAWLSH
jgi:hypothetical protein